MANYSLQHNPAAYTQGLKVSEQQAKTFAVPGSNLNKTNNLKSLEKASPLNGNYAVSKVSATGTTPGGAQSAVSSVVDYEAGGMKALSTTNDPSKSKPTSRAGLTFPSGLTDYYIRFQFVEYKRRNADESAKVTIGNTIYLPLPSNLEEAFSMNISDKSAASIFGFNVGFAEDAVREAFDGGIEGAKAQLSQLGQQFQRIGEGNINLNDTSLTAGRLAAGAADTLIPGASNIASFYERIFGVSVNPFLAMQFEGVNLRSHSFRFKLAATDENESRTIRDIIKEFKTRMHPELSSGGLLFKYPDVARVAFGPNKDNLYPILDCFVESISVNYAPSGVPAFFAGTKEPVEIDLTVNLKEIRPITREDIV